VKAKKGLGKMDMSAISGTRIVGERLVLDPAITDAEYWHLRRTRSGPDVGKVMAQVNLVELIGGLARIDKRTALHEEVAARYRRIWDHAQIGSARAMDYTQVRVDTSGGGSHVLDFGDWARFSYSDTVQYLGVVRSSLVERVIVHDQSLRQVAGAGGKAAQKVRDELLDILDDLAVHFQLAPRKRP
jgi:hypothetical protein